MAVSHSSSPFEFRCFQCRTRDSANRRTAPKLSRQTDFLHRISLALKEFTVSHALQNWIFIGAYAYVTFTFVKLPGKGLSRRRVQARPARRR
jgi:hypothetical protein